MSKIITSNVTVSEITALALKLYELDPSAERSSEAFKAKFAFAFDLLVDAELQLQALAHKLNNAAAGNSARTNHPVRRAG